jgi:hypothetical protein
VSRMTRWWVAGLVAAGVFGVVTWVAGAFLLPLVMKADTNCWVVASAAGVALGAVAGLAGQSWATRERGDDGKVAVGGDRSISAGKDISGIVSTGDDAVNIQYRRDQ